MRDPTGYPDYLGEYESPVAMTQTGFEAHVVLTERARRNQVTYKPAMLGVQWLIEVSKMFRNTLEVQTVQTAFAELEHQGARPLRLELDIALMDFLN